jgi:hypothetical protein
MIIEHNVPSVEYVRFLIYRTERKVRPRVVG